MLNKVIAKKFKATKYQNVKEWWAESKCPLSQELCTKVIFRGREPSYPAAMQMLFCLQVPAAEIAEILKSEGDTVFYKMIQADALTDEESTVIGLFRGLDDAKKEVALRMLEQLGR